MIAPYHQTKDPPPPSGIRRARQVVASMLLTGETRNTSSRVPGWKAWLFTGWVVAAMVVYFAYMFGWF